MLFWLWIAAAFFFGAACAFVIDHIRFRYLTKKLIAEAQANRELQWGNSAVSLQYEERKDNA